MTNPTTPFSWQMPTSSDLVTDLPADFAVFGQAVATSMADLLGGTTGQVLSKASNTDMDFTWVAQDDSNAIQNAIVDAKGDLIAATAADTPARLAVGNNGETLVADSSTSTGLRYTAGTVQANPFINSAFQVWQRGTSFVPSGTSSYTADRWQGYRGVTGSTITRQTTSDTTNLPNIQYCARVQRDSGNTSTTAIYLGQSFESVNSIPFAGKTVTFSFYARKGANYSQASSQIPVLLQGGALTDANVITAGGWSNVLTVNATLTTTWQRFTGTATVSSSFTQLGIYAEFTPVGTAGAADYYEITGVQLDIGSVALPFRTNAGTIQGELAACQRYFQKSYNTDSNPGTSGAAGPIYGSQVASTTSTGQLVLTAHFQTTMRTTPTITVYDLNGTSGACNRETVGLGGDAGQSANVTQQGAKSFVLYGTGTNRAGLACHYTASAEL